MYENEQAKELLRQIILRFRQKAEERGHHPLILIMPQLLDLELTEGERAPYEMFYEELQSDVDVVDMTRIFKQKNFHRLYIDDQYGGHLSVEGNRLVAVEIQSWLQKRKLL